MNESTGATYRFVAYVIRSFMHVTCRIDAPNLEEFPRQGPFIAISNHTGQVEVPLLFAELQPRPLIGWAKEEAWSNPLFRWLFGIWRAIPLRRGEADMSALKQALAALKQGYIFGLAPEGTRNRTGHLQRAMPGAVLLALHSAAPIIPVAHWGGEKFRENLGHLRRTDFHVRVGAPFIVETGGVKVTAEIRQQIVDEMMYRLAALLPEDYRGVYADMTMASSNFLRPFSGAA